MKRFFSALLVLSILSTQAWAESAVEEKAVSDNYDYDRRVHDLYAWLLLTDVTDDPEYDQITFFYDWFMDATVGVTIINQPGLMNSEGVSIPNAYLEASIKSRADENYEQDGDLHHDRFITDIYQIKISDKDFNAVVEYLDEHSFWSDPIAMPYDSGPDEDGYITICEGPYFVLDAGIAARAHFISRGGCGEDFSRELDHAKTLLNLAKEKIPQITDRLSKSERNLRPD